LDVTVEVHQNCLTITGVRELVGNTSLQLQNGQKSIRQGTDHEWEDRHHDEQLNKGKSPLTSSISAFIASPTVPGRTPPGNP
jgi:hypothetical protein